jgi:hypothetical protein
MPQCRICGRADLVWRQERFKDGELHWVMHDPHNPNKEFAHNTHQHICPWKAVKHMKKKDRPYYWRTL